MKKYDIIENNITLSTINKKDYTKSFKVFNLYNLKLLSDLNFLVPKSFDNNI